MHLVAPEGEPLVPVPRAQELVAYRVGLRLVVHALTTAPTRTEEALPTQERAPRVGFVVSKAVGNSVVRHRVTRQLRHLVADRLGTLPAGCTLVVRALPTAAGSASAELAEDLDSALRRLQLRGDAA